MESKALVKADGDAGVEMDTGREREMGERVGGRRGEAEGRRGKEGRAKGEGKGERRGNGERKGNRVGEGRRDWKGSS